MGHQQAEEIPLLGRGNESVLDMQEVLNGQLRGAEQAAEGDLLE